MIERLGSPSGPSTLITSAPQSPSTTAAAGAAMKELMSSTRSPASGRADSTMQYAPILPILALHGEGRHGVKAQTEFPDCPDRRSAVRRVGHMRPSLHEDAEHRPYRPGGSDVHG